MKASDIPLWRLRTQRVAGPAARKFASASEAVHWMGAVQSQDYLAAKWAVGQRLEASTDAAFDDAFSRGEILRTHVLRPTWHFVTPADLRWMLALTAPRVNALRAYYNRQNGLDGAVFARSNAAIVKALQGGEYRTRDELGEVLQKGKIGGSPERRGNILLDAELEGLVCSGPLRGKQQTYALVEDRAPEAARLPSRDEALAELARRFFVSHGPATLKDYAWWSGLTVADARVGMEAATPRLAREVVGGKTYFFEDRAMPRVGDDPAIYLLPCYDEYVVAYVDRDVLLDARHRTKLDARNNPLFQNVVVRNGRIVGTWKRSLKKSTVSVTTQLFVRFDAAEKSALASAIARYARFMGRQVG
jgi:Winged helix DNA-binding domain